jgi:hypothetical protein
MSVSCECCVLSDTVLCNGPITGIEEVLPSMVCMSVIAEPQQSGPLPLQAVKP